MKDYVLKITIGGILSALVMLATVVIMIPIPSNTGFFNLGDGVIFGIAAVLGPFAAICAAIGSGLGDLVSYPIYIPATVLIKGCMGYLAGMVLKKKPELRWYGMIVLFAACEIIMVVGYFLYEYLLTGLGNALAAIPTNMLQGVVGIIIGLAIVPLARRIKTLIKI
jgi:uncharacterized membrane protein